MAHRYFTQDIHESTARITGADAAHLCRVLRAKVGEALTLCDGAGTDYEATIRRISAEEVELDILNRAPSTAEPSLRVAAYVGVAKGERMDAAVQKCVELGAAQIIPFFSEFTVVKPKKEDAKTARWQRIAIEAAKQCGRGVLPAVAQPLDFDGVLAEISRYEKALFFYELGGQPLREVYGGETNIAIITGAEGGFSPGEAARAKAAGCHTVGLGPRILRCETAPAAVLAALMCLSGNLE